MRTDQIDAAEEARLVSRIRELARLVFDPNKTNDEILAQANLQRDLLQYYGDPNRKSEWASLAKQAGYDPDYLGKALLGSSDPQDVSDLLNSLGLGGGYGSNRNTQSTDNSQNTRNTNQTSVQGTNSRTVSTDNRTVRQYVDLPTAEEFLDNFDTAFQAHLANLAQRGVSSAAIDFANQNKSLFFGEYLQKQVEQAQAGIPMFRVSGADGNERLVGQRTGDVQHDVGDQQTGQTVTDATHTSQDQQGTETQTSTGTQGNEAGSGTVNESNATKSRQQTEQDEQTTQSSLEHNQTDNSLNTTEQIYARDQLGYVATLNPGDFLNDTATAQRLNFLYAGHKGDRQRAAQTSLGADYIGTGRRI